MKQENEITVEVDLGLEEVKELLEKNNFKLLQEYSINDIYMINKDYLEEKDKYKLLNNCLILRNIITDKKNEKTLTYKYKEYDDNGDIIKQNIFDSKIDDIDSMKKVLEAINYEELIKLYDHLMVYGTDKDELVVQIVNDKHIYIEIEEKCWFIDRVYKSIDELKNVITKIGIPIKNNDYFVKKVLVELDDRNKDK